MVHGIHNCFIQNLHATLPIFLTRVLRLMNLLNWSYMMSIALWVNVSPVVKLRARMASFTALLEVCRDNPNSRVASVLNVMTPTRESSGLAPTIMLSTILTTNWSSFAKFSWFSRLEEASTRKKMSAGSLLQTVDKKIH